MPSELGATSVPFKEWKAARGGCSVIKARATPTWKFMGLSEYLQGSTTAKLPAYGSPFRKDSRFLGA